MSMSLRDQLLKAGLVNENRPSRPPSRNRNSSVWSTRTRSTRTTPSARRRSRPGGKLARDQELNRQQQESREEGQGRADQATYRRDAPAQLESDDYYNFVDAKKVKRIAVNDLIRDKLSRGSLAIVSYDGRYEIVPRDAAVKIQERDPRRVVLLNVQSQEPDEDDPYKDYVVPDDLMW